MTPIQLHAYLARIDLAAAPAPDLAGLHALQRAHRRAIPFENLDIPLGRGIHLDPDALFAKLVTGRRGGYCFEQNGVFLAALHALGFAARPLLARVWLLATDTPPRTHTLNLVTIAGEEWIADAGFGGSDTPPMRLVEQELVQDEGIGFALRRDREHGWTLEREGARQYSFTTDPVWPADLALASHWTSTAPASRFLRQCIVSIPGADGLTALTGTRLSRPNATETELHDAASYRAALARHFGLAFTPEEVEALGLFG